MLPFDPSKLTVTYHRMKRVTSALGGSITLENPEDPAGKGIRMAVPFAVARKFIKLTKITQYPKAVQVAIMKYGDMVINLERDVLSNLKGDYEYPEGRWISNLEKFVTEALPEHLEGMVWFFDGRYMYAFMGNELHKLRYGGEGVQLLSRDGSFRSGRVTTIDLGEIDAFRAINVIREDRGVLAFVDGDEGFAVTPPIWKNVEAIGSSALVETDSRVDHEDYKDKSEGVTVGDERRAQLMDMLDSHYALNLNFTLAAAKSLSNHFGFDAVDPLQLPEVMLSLQTVNIPSLPKEIKATFSIGLTPSHGIAWLIGLFDQAEDMDSYLAVRSALKYLTTKGMFHKTTTRIETLFVGNEFKLPPKLEVRVTK